MNNYWTDETRQLIRTYINTTGTTDRNILFAQLYKPLLITINHALHKYNITDDDYGQDCMIFLYTKVLNRITDDRVVTAHQYIYNSLNNHIKNRIKKDNRIRNQQYIYVDDIDITTEDNNVNVIDVKINIVRKLDEMVRKERVINRPNSIFLLSLKDYLLSNDFDPREFNQFVQHQMNINYNTYNIIASRLGIRTKLLNEKYIKDCFIRRKGD